MNGDEARGLEWRGDGGDASQGEVKKARKAQATTEPHWRVSPWHYEVDGRQLVGEVVRKLRRHIVMTEDAARATAKEVTITARGDRQGGEGLRV